MPDDEVRILYIAGWGRSGSTILGNILGQCEAFTHVGELWYLWESGIRNDQLCGCGEPFSDCVFWQEVRSEFEKTAKPIAPDQMIKLHKRFARTRNLPQLLLTRRVPVTNPDFQKYTNELRILYSSIHKIAGTNYIIDSSKLPAYAFNLSRTPGFHVSILHLLRDPRGTAYSWKKRKFDLTQNRYMIQSGTFHNALMWTTWNFFIEKVWGACNPTPYLRIKYEDFVLNPKHTLEKILQFSGVRDSLAFIEEPSSVKLGKHHTVSGNPVRTKTGVTHIRSDQEWVRKLSVMDKLLTTILTAPLLRHYGYPIMKRSESRDHIILQ